jgi:hypothetical protein
VAQVCKGAVSIAPERAVLSGSACGSDAGQRLPRRSDSHLALVDGIDLVKRRKRIVVQHGRASKLKAIDRLLALDRKNRSGQTILQGIMASSSNV